MAQYQAPHSWQLSPGDAMQLQNQLAKQAIHSDQITQVNYVAGVDVGFENNNQITRAAVAVLNYPELELVEYAIAQRPTEFPYIPGLLSFREIPSVLDALNKSKQIPDLLPCDGQGIAHPRRLGIATPGGYL